MMSWYRLFWVVSKWFQVSLLSTSFLILFKWSRLVSRVYVFKWIWNISVCPVDVQVVFLNYFSSIFSCSKNVVVDVVWERSINVCFFLVLGSLLYCSWILIGLLLDRSACGCSVVGGGSATLPIPYLLEDAVDVEEEMEV